MSLIFRLAGQRCGNRFLKTNAGIVSCIRPVTLKSSIVEEAKDESHDEHNMKLGRPQSPHLSIYRLQLTSMLSISHRATGMVLSAYAIGLGLAAIAAPESIPQYIDQLASYGSGAVAFVKFSLAFPMTYHFWNGIRHLFWDTGKFLTIREVYLTGYIMLALAIGSAASLTAMQLH